MHNVCEGVRETDGKIQSPLVPHPKSSRTRKVGRIERHLAEEIYILDSLLRKLFQGRDLYGICFGVACDSRFRFLCKMQSKLLCDSLLGDKRLGSEN
jgi:hypothetical protein